MGGEVRRTKVMVLSHSARVSVSKPVSGPVEFLELQVLHLLENVVPLGDLGLVTARLQLLLCRRLPMLWNEIRC